MLHSRIKKGCPVVCYVMCAVLYSCMMLYVLLHVLTLISLSFFLRYSFDKLYPDVTNGLDRGSCCSFWAGPQQLPAPSIAHNYCKDTREGSSCIVTTWDSSTCNKCNGVIGNAACTNGCGDARACTYTTTEKGGTADCSRCPPCATTNVLDEICIRSMIKTAKEQAIVTLYTQSVSATTKFAGLRNAAVWDHAWLGGRYSTANSRWEWDDGTPIAGGYENWAAGEGGAGTSNSWLCMKGKKRSEANSVLCCVLCFVS